jgi:hypothetical protein
MFVSKKGPAMQHNWIKSTLGHGNLLCNRCWTTDLEAAALGIMNECDTPEIPAPGYGALKGSPKTSDAGPSGSAGDPANSDK